jgi:dienelactone hydrolase
MSGHLVRLVSLRSVIALGSFAWLASLGSGCSNISLDPAPAIIHARFDPDAKVVPMPTDVLRDAVTQRLDLPVDDADLSDAEREFYTFLETLDGWSTAMSATVEFTGPINKTSVTADTLQVWKWSAVPQRLTDVTVTISDDAKKVTIDPPRAGWERGARYVVLMRGGEAGVEGKVGEPVECDAAFYFLRQTERLDTAEHQRAFPGNTAAERADNANKLEKIREDLAPVFDYFGERGIPRAKVAALWAFTVTKKTELAMDKASQRMPIPNELLIDPATGKVDIPPAAWDSPPEVEAKYRLRDYDGFATSANLLFEFTGKMDPATVNATNVNFYRLADGAAPVKLEAAVTLMPDLVHVIVTPKVLPLPEGTPYAVVVRKGVRDADGNAIVPMPAAFLMTEKSTVFADGKSLVGAVPDEDAVRVESARTKLAPVLEALGRDDIVGAWPYRTLTIHKHLADVAASAQTLGISPDPDNLVHKTPFEALGDFALAISSLAFVGDVYYGTIKSPIFLDPTTRAWREDGKYTVEDVPFTMTVPRNLPAGAKVPVVIFGHAICTERRFVLALGDALAQKGFAAIAIDLPYHGTRTYCMKGGPISAVNPQTGELTSVEPCASGTTCNDLGKCVDASGHGNALATWPVIGMPVASGAAFIEIDHIARTKDHFNQAVIDLSALERSLHQGDWHAMLGRDIDTDKIYYAGQSLGGIIGATWLSVSSDIKRAVLNVPGADLVDMFRESGWFKDSVNAFFTRQHIAKGSFEEERFLDVARWFVDAVDPQNVAEDTGNRALFIQMATLDFIIPNWTTQLLEQLTRAPHRDYIAEHAFLVIPVEPEFGRGGRELAQFLAGELQP